MNAEMFADREKLNERLLSYFQLLENAAKKGYYPKKELIEEFAKTSKLQIRELSNFEPTKTEELTNKKQTKFGMLSSILGVKQLSQKEIQDRNQENINNVINRLKIARSKGFAFRFEDEKRLFARWGFQVRRETPSETFLKSRQICLLDEVNSAMEDTGHHSSINKQEQAEIISKIDFVVRECINQNTNFSKLFEKTEIDTKNESIGKILVESILEDLDNFEPRNVTIAKSKEAIVPITIKIYILQKFPGRVGGGERALMGELGLRKKLAQKLLEFASQYDDCIFLLSEEGHPAFTYLFDAIKLIEWDNEDLDNYCFKFYESNPQQVAKLKKILQIIVTETDNLITRVENTAEDTENKIKNLLFSKN